MKKHSLSLTLLVLLLFVQEGLSRLEYSTIVDDVLSDYMQTPGLLDFDSETGYIPLNQLYPDNTNTSLFYQLFTKVGTTMSTIKAGDPLIVWIEGWPGCSSQRTIWQGLGPLTVNSNLKLEYNYDSWNYAGNLLVVDIHPQVGFSHTNLDQMDISTTEQLGQIFLNFLENFFLTHKKLEICPLYLFSNTYGGHYLPHFARLLLEDDITFWTNLEGIGIGNGVFDYQFQLVDNANSLFSQGLYSQASRNQMQQQAMKIFKDYNEQNFTDAKILIQNITTNVFKKLNIWPYNYDYSVSGPNTNNYQQLLQNKQFLQVYGVQSGKSSYQECNSQVASQFEDDQLAEFYDDLSYVLDDILVLLYQGQLDVFVNSVGIQRILDQVGWSKMNIFSQQKKQLWQDTTKQQTYGSYKQYDNLIVATILNSGVRVEYDKPEVSLDMVKKTVQDQWPITN